MKRYDSFKSKTVAEVDVHFPVEHRRLSRPLKKVSLAELRYRTDLYSSFATHFKGGADCAVPCLIDRLMFSFALCFAGFNRGQGESSL